MVRRSGWSIALAASFLATSPAQARDQAYAISLPAGDLADILEALASQLGISLVYEARLPAARTRAIHGRMSAHEALDRLLRDMPVQAVQIGPRAFRIAARARRSGPAGAPAKAQANEEIVVTARKLPEALSTVSGAIAVYEPGEVTRPDRPNDLRDVARAVGGLSVTNAGPGRDRAFIRGLADSPFNGFSQSTVSVQFDDGRITYDAPDPGLQLVDIARIEVLKGPQGPLYGTGALGGVYRIVTNRPVIGTVSAEGIAAVQAVASGGFGGNGEAMLNLPIAANRAAIRLVGYARSDAGWVETEGGGTNVNRSQIFGGRAALRIAPATGWTADFSGAYQSIRTADSQYVDREFEDLTRSDRLPEPRRGTFGLAQSTLSGPIGTVRLTAVTSHSWQAQQDMFDVRGADAQLGIAGASRYRDNRNYRVFDQEIRLSSAPGDAVSWTAGFSYISASTRATGDVEAQGRSATRYFDLHRRVTETAVYADGAYPIAGQLRLSVGARLFRATTEDERQEELDARAASHALIGFTPSASLSYPIPGNGLVYLRLGSAFRPGGIDPANGVTGRYVGDTVHSIELGARASLDDGRLALVGAGFQTNWRHVQSDYLEANGLVATRNAGDAAIVGIEATGNWLPGRGWKLGAGFTAQQPRLVNAADGGDLPEDRRLPIVPDFAGRLTVERTYRVFGIEMLSYTSLNLTGPSRLSFDDGLDRRMSGYAIARIGASARFDLVQLAVDIDNVLDTRADSYAYGNPFLIRGERQYTPVRPRTVSISVSRRF